MGGRLAWACRTLDAYTVAGAWGRGWPHTDRRWFGPGARTAKHAGRPKSPWPPRHGPVSCAWVKARAFFPHRRPPPAPGEGRAAVGKECSEESREATGSRHEAGGVVGPRRQKKRLMELDSHPHRR